MPQESPEKRELDPVKYKEVLYECMQKGQVDTNTLRKNLRIGQAKAERLLKDLARDGIVEETGSKTNRSFIINREQLESYVASGFKNVKSTPAPAEALPTPPVIDPTPPLPPTPDTRDGLDRCESCGQPIEKGDGGSLNGKTYHREHIPSPHDPDGLSPEIATTGAPEAADIEEELEDLPKTERGELGRGFATFGFRVERRKNKFFADTFSKISKKFEKSDRNGKMARFTKALSATYKDDAEAAQKKITAVETDKAGKLTKLSNVAYLAKNILRPIRLIADATGMTPGSVQRITMGYFMIMGRLSGATKEAFLLDEKFLEKTQLDIDRAEEEAWKIYKAAQEKSGKIAGETDAENSVSAEELKTAYLNEIPSDLQDRLRNASVADIWTQKLFRKHLEFNVKLLNRKIDSIDTDRKLSDEKKEIKKNQLMRRWEKRLVDYDRVLTQTGEVHDLAMVAQYAETLSKNIVRGMTLDTLYMSVEKLFENVSQVMTGDFNPIDSIENQPAGNNKTGTEDIPDIERPELLSKLLGMGFKEAVDENGDRIFIGDLEGKTIRVFPDGYHYQMLDAEGKVVGTGILSDSGAVNDVILTPDQTPEATTSTPAGQTEIPRREATIVAPFGADAATPAPQAPTQTAPQLDPEPTLETPEPSAQPQTAPVEDNSEQIRRALAAEEARRALEAQTPPPVENPPVQEQQPTQQPAPQQSAPAQERPAPIQTGKRIRIGPPVEPTPIENSPKVGDILIRNGTRIRVIGVDGRGNYNYVIEPVPIPGTQPVNFSVPIEPTGGVITLPTRAVEVPFEQAPQQFEGIDPLTGEPQWQNPDNLTNNSEIQTPEPSVEQENEAEILEDTTAPEPTAPEDDTLGASNQSPTPEELSNKIKMQIDSQAENEVPVIPEGNSTANINAVLQAHPEFVQKNPFNLTGEKLFQAYEMHKGNVSRMFPGEKIEEWNSIRKLKAGDLLKTKNYNERDPLMNYLKKLYEYSDKLKPENRIFRRSETVEEYMARSLQKIAERGGLDQVKIRN